MPSLNDIQTLADRIGREFHPDKGILFGSHVRGTAGADSDVDLLLIMPRDGESKHEEAAAIYSKCHPGFPFDVLVRTQEEFEARLKLRDWFMRDIARQGKVLRAK